MVMRGVGVKTGEGCFEDTLDVKSNYITQVCQTCVYTINGCVTVGKFHELVLTACP